MHTTKQNGVTIRWADKHEMRGTVVDNRDNKRIGLVIDSGDVWTVEFRDGRTQQVTNLTIAITNLLKG